jgi:2-polyprenyl-6-methoxyphenol hydroxylase-like FAD-dependent oxidoreductase
MAPRAVVVGGGIAGLASALALTEAGWDVTVLERSEDLTEVGAGVALSRNAVAALGGLGLSDDDVAALGAPTRAEGTRRSDGAPILTIPDTAASRAAVALVGVHRGRLHGALLARARAAGVTIETGVRADDVAPGEPGARPAVAAGRGADLVVGADGVRSATRSALVGLSPTYSGYSSWRAIVPREPQVRTLRQYWGPHAEFGVMPVSADEAYWYGYVRMPEGRRFADELGAARGRFAGWADDVARTIDLTAPGALLRHDVYSLPGGAPTYVRGRVALVGDAAHAFLPTMGQGAATALEDGLCVGLLVGHPVARGGSLAAALADYDAARRPRCRTLGRAARMSAVVGAHLGGGVRQRLRNGFMRLTPASLVGAGAEAAMGWRPPAPAEPA